jgi:hypothetical protein
MGTTRAGASRIGASTIERWGLCGSASMTKFAGDGAVARVEGEGAGDGSHK